MGSCTPFYQKYYKLRILGFTLVSCDEDDDIANTLWGVWKGNMYAYSQYNGTEYPATYSILAFDKDPYDYTSGSGYWIDYYSNAPWDNFSSHIQWKVYNGQIAIYSEVEGRTYYITQYSLNYNYFSGYISDGNSQPIDFNLSKTAAPDWNDYNYNGYDYDDDYEYSYYSMKKSVGIQSAPVRHIGAIQAQKQK